MLKIKCSICGTILEYSEGQETVFCSECASTHNIAALQKENAVADLTAKVQPKPTEPEDKGELEQNQPPVELSLTDKEISACNYLLKVIKAELSTSFGNHLSLYKSDTTYSWKKGGDKKFAKNMDIVLKRCEECKQYLIKEMTEAGYSNIEIKIESSTSKCSTEKDWAAYNRKLEDYYSHSSAYQSYFPTPDNEKNGYSTYYTLEVSCSTNNKKNLRQGKKKIRSFSDFYFMIDDYIFGAIKIITVGAIIAGLIFFVGRPIVKFVKGASEVVDSAFNGSSSDDDSADSGDEEPEFYYVMADDCSAINIRKSSSKSSKVLTVVRDHETKLIPTGITSGDWIQVKVDLYTGWVLNEIVKKVSN